MANLFIAEVFRLQKQQGIANTLKLKVILNARIQARVAIGLGLTCTGVVLVGSVKHLDKSM